MLAPDRPRPRGLRAITLPFRHADVLRRCGVLRVFQVTGAIPALIARARFGVPYVTTYGFSYGSLSEPGPKRPLKALVERLGLRHAAAVITTTEALRVRAARLARRVELIPNGVDSTRFVPAALPRRIGADGCLRVLYVGRLSPEKNLPAVIEAAAMIKRRAAVQVTMVGAGPLRELLAGQAWTAGVELELPGVVDQSRLPAVYAAADLFVLASFTEGHPKVLLEAMSAGLPCVASDCEGNRSLIEPERTGLLFDAQRPAELAARMERLLDDGELAASLGQAARRLIVASYDLRTMVGREIALLREIARRT